MRRNRKLKFLILNLNFAFLILNFHLSSALAWKVPIEVATISDSGEKVYNRLVIGKEPDATDGFDNLWDTPAILSHPDPDNALLLRAYLNGRGNGGEETKYLWKDIRGLATNHDTIWEITVDSVPVSKTVSVSWEIPQGALKKGERLVLKDNGRIGAAGEPVQVDVTQTSTYAFVSEGAYPRSLSLVLSADSPPPSGGGSGFGCGTIRSHRDGPSNGGTAMVSIFLLFSPILFFELRRLTRLRLSI